MLECFQSIRILHNEKLDSVNKLLTKLSETQLLLNTRLNSLEDKINSLKILARTLANKSSSSSAVNSSLSLVFKTDLKNCVACRSVRKSRQTSAVPRDDVSIYHKNLASYDPSFGKLNTVNIVNQILNFLSLGCLIKPVSYTRSWNPKSVKSPSLRKSNKSFVIKFASQAAHDEFLVKARSFQNLDL